MSTNMAEMNKFQLERIIDAAQGKSLEESTKADATFRWNGASNESFATEHDRKMFLVGLKSDQIDAAIASLNLGNYGFSLEEKDKYLATLNRMRADIGKIQSEARQALEHEKFTINALIPDKTESEKGYERLVDRQNAVNSILQQVTTGKLTLSNGKDFVKPSDSNSVSFARKGNFIWGEITQDDLRPVSVVDAQNTVIAYGYVNRQNQLLGSDGKTVGNLTGVTIDRIHEITFEPRISLGTSSK